MALVLNNPQKLICKEIETKPKMYTHPLFGLHKCSVMWISAIYELFKESLGLYCQTTNILL